MEKGNRKNLRNHVLFVLVALVIALCAAFTGIAAPAEDATQPTASVPFDAKNEALAHVKGTDIPNNDIVRNWREVKSPSSLSEDDMN